MSQFFADFLFRLFLREIEEKTPQDEKRTQDPRIPKEIILSKLKDHFKYSDMSEEPVMFEYLFDLCDKHNLKSLNLGTFLSFMRCVEVYDRSFRISQNVAVMKSIFAGIDVDQNGFLSKMEIFRAMQKFAPYIEKNESLDNTINTIKKRSSGMTNVEELSETQFLEIVVKQNEFQEYHKQLYGEMFDRIDEDKSGTIEVNELRVLFREIYPLGIEIKNAEQLVINFFDPTKSPHKSITKEQFFKFITFALAEKGQSNYLTKNQFLKILCKLVDSNKNGMMDSYEIQHILRCFGMNESKITKWFKKHGGENVSFHIDELIELL